MFVYLLPQKLEGEAIMSGRPYDWKELLSILIIMLVSMIVVHLLDLFSADISRLVDDQKG